MRPVLLAVIISVFLSAGAGAAAPDWSQAAREDLAAMHDIIRDNHPGPVDPLNPSFNDWLNHGEALLLPQARAARSEHDYQLVLRDYANGFADGHVNIAMADPESYLWPGFLVRTEALSAPVRVSLLARPPAAPPGLAVGDRLLSCGGIPVGTLLQDRVVRPRLNRHVPQRLSLRSAWLMVADADDRAAQTPSCVFAAAGHRRTIRLRWRPIDAAALALAQQQSSGIAVPPLGVRRIGDVWLISLPTFDPVGAQVARMQSVIAFTRTQAATLHRARHVVIDLRGNDGGNDEWGDEVLAALWSDQAVTAVENSVSLKVEWRVSARNIAALRTNAANAKIEGQADISRYYAGLADRMSRAAARDQTYMPEDAPATAPLPRLTSPFAHPVYMLTTPYCASACLDVIDVANDLPGLVRVGLETASDTDYLDTASAVLPSGHAVLHYAMRVYRERPRAANASYTPQIPWPGGEMTDTTIAHWIDQLP